MTITLYGIPNCDTVKKARTWLSEHNQSFTFHDFKKDGITRELISGWLQHVSADVLINRKGTTWRKLTDEQKGAVDKMNADNASANDTSAVELMLSSPSVIKRPVLSYNGTTNVGFSDALYEQIFQQIFTNKF